MHPASLACSAKATGPKGDRGPSLVLRTPRGDKELVAMFRRSPRGDEGTC
jgi:hypothetical protein